MDKKAPNNAEDKVLRQLYKGGITWRGEESVDKAIDFLHANRQMHDANDVRLGVVLNHANATETPPPTKARHHEEPMEKMKPQLDKLAEWLANKKKGEK